MDELDLSLQSLIQETCSHRPGSPQRRKAVNTLLRMLLKSGRIRTKGDEIYEEALQKTMLNVTKTLCEKYDPSRGSFLTWFNTCLRNQHTDEIRAVQRDRQRKQSVWQTDDAEVDPLDQVPAPVDGNLLLQTWNALVQWIKDDPDQILRRCHIENNPNANGQSLAYLRLVMGQEWQQIAAEVGSPRGAISSHWSRKCQPLLQQWLEQNHRLFGEKCHDR
jgi:RNA polymerase sigma factor (sigma-70 family)